MRPNEPAPDELADEDDELGWDRSVHGRMRDQDTDDHAVPTESWNPA